MEISPVEVVQVVCVTVIDGAAGVTGCALTTSVVAKLTQPSAD